jgi:hypothetical protein
MWENLGIVVNNLINTNCVDSQLPSPDGSGYLPILENKALAVAFLNRE